MQNEHVLLNKLLVIEIEILIERTTGQPNHFQASLKISSLYACCKCII